ncbi:MAG: C_GCAxxG_C_C family protein [Chloroflexota bacterium]|nr:MAG: C_GCAxxG_C_C family protein [Chloroflexota bacterium]
MKKQMELGLLSRLENKASENLSLCGNCAQTTFMTLDEEFQLGGEVILKALTPFPGIALRGETCGAVTGSLMALGLVFGRDRDALNNWQAYLDSLPPARRFCRRFENELGSTMCEDIIEAKFGRKFDLANPVDAMQYMNCGALDKCGQVIGTGVKIAAEIISRSGK